MDKKFHVTVFAKVGRAIIAERTYTAPSFKFARQAAMAEFPNVSPSRIYVMEI